MWCVSNNYDPRKGPIIDVFEANFEKKPYDLLIGTNIISQGILFMKPNNFSFCL